MFDQPTAGNNPESLDEETPNNQAVSITVGIQYVKDLSFECPNAPFIFRPTNEQPVMEMGVNVQSRSIGDRSFEVMLMLKLEARLAAEVAFIGEITYSGIFTIPEIEEGLLREFLLIEAPRLLFPFARQALLAAVHQGGFPHVVIQPIDFVALYNQNMGSITKGQAIGNA